MQTIPLNATASQTLSVVLDNQYVQIDVFQKAFGLYMNVYLDNVLVIAGVVCENLNTIVKSAYRGLSGDLVFLDNQGSDDPVYSGLGSRFSLVYLSASDLAALANP